jgi:hypothetical protein
MANMYGIVHGHRQHAMLGIIESGVGNASLTHYGSQVFLDFNFTYVTFNYRSTYIQYLNQAKTSSVNLLQAKPNPIHPVMRYQFLTEAQADYVGIARQFSQWRFVDGLRQPIHDEIPLHVDVLALESKPGLFARQPVIMTSVKEAQAIFTSLQNTVTTNLDAVYLGWNQGGYSYTAPNYTQWDRRLGSARDLSDWYMNDGQPTGMTLRLGVDPYRAYRRGNGYRQNEIMQTIGQEFVDRGAYYYLKPEAGLARLQTAHQTTETLGFNHLAIETIGNFVSSDFSGNPLSKSGAIEAIKETTQAFPNVSVYQPFSHLWDAQSLFDLPMYSSQQARFTDTVPLIPLMIQGYRHGFGRAGNFFSNTRNELLRLIDYGLYPSFFLTEASAYQLLDTPSEHIFTSRYADWAPAIQAQYQFVAGALNAVYGETVVSRTILALGVVQLTYTSGKTIYINYTGAPFTYLNRTISPMSYEVDDEA